MTFGQVYLFTFIFAIIPLSQVQKTMKYSGEWQNPNSKGPLTVTVTPQADQNWLLHFDGKLDDDAFHYKGIFTSKLTESGNTMLKGSIVAASENYTLVCIMSPQTLSCHYISDHGNEGDFTLDLAD